MKQIKNKASFLQRDHKLLLTYHNLPILYQQFDILLFSLTYEYIKNFLNKLFIMGTEITYNNRWTCWTHIAFCYWLAGIQAQGLFFCFCFLIRGIVCLTLSLQLFLIKREKKTIRSSGRVLYDFFTWKKVKRATCLVQRATVGVSSTWSLFVPVRACFVIFFIPASALSCCFNT